ncbi:MAG: hypothetical protein QM770_08815 [Tepidisphaeraceae bacterium]
MREQLTAYLSNPSPATYAALRKRVVSDPAWQPYGTDLQQLRDAIDAKQYDVALQRFQSAPVSLLLCPEAHVLASRALDAKGDALGADVERMLGSVFLAGIRGTGNGSLEKPFVVSRIEDERAVLGVLSKKTTTQMLVHTETGRHLDVWQCEDGSQVHFDITDVFPKALG